MTPDNLTEAQASTQKETTMPKLDDASMATEAQGDWVLVPREATEEMIHAFAQATLGMGQMSGPAKAAIRWRAAILAAPANPLLADLVAACLEWARDASDMTQKTWLPRVRMEDAARALGRHLLAQEGEGR